MSTSYTARLISFLAVQRPHEQIESLDDYINNENLNLLVMERTSNHDLMKDAESGSYFEAWKAFQAGRGKLVANADEALEMVLANKNNIFIADQDMIDHLHFQKEIFCSMHVGSSRYVTNFKSFATRRGSEFSTYKYFTKFDMRRSLDRLMEAGMREKVEKNLISMGIHCIQQKPASPEITMDTFQGLLYLVICGGFLASVAIIIELLYHKINRP